jgi:tetratricopeptide (TPR) repeat protein
MKHLIFAVLIVFLVCGCKGMATSAEEYYSIGMAYFELGRYEEAEKWFNRAKQADRTMIASQYNLGRIAFETQNYSEAAKHFEDILIKDPDNVLALKAAAYTRIKMGDIAAAEKHYSRLLEIIPESADDGYNHALVLYSMGRYEEALKVLDGYPFALQEPTDVLLMYARVQKALGRVEAIDNYSKWLANNSDIKARFEYAQVLEHHELYARALEEYKKALSESEEAANVNRAEIRFCLARVLLIADSSSPEGMAELNTAINEGFSDISAVEALQKNQKVNSANRESIRAIVNDMARKEEAARQAREQQE